MKRLPAALLLLFCSLSTLHAASATDEQPAYESRDLELEGALTELKEQAERGDVAATRQVYLRYAVAGHSKQAVAWADKLRAQMVRRADEGDVRAMLLLGSNYLTGNDYTTPDESQAAVWLSKATEAGEPSAAYILGDFFARKGQLTESAKAYAKAFAAYEAPAQQGNINALYWRGYMLQNGLGTEADAAAGIALMQEAAEKGSEWAAVQLFKTYAQGIGTERDESKAVAYARQAADKTDNGMMAYAAACAYLNGQGAEKDETLGRQYLEKAVAANIADAIYLKGTLLEKEGRVTDAFALYNQAASMSHAEAMVAAGRMLLYGGEKVEKDEARGLSMLQTACDRLDSLRAPYELGRYYDSIGEPEMANAWYTTASDRGVAEAMARRGLLHLNPFSGLKWSPSVAYRWWRIGAEAGDADCLLYKRLFLYLFIPLIVIVAFGVPAFIVHRLNRKAMKKEQEAGK